MGRSAEKSFLILLPNFVGEVSASSRTEGSKAPIALLMTPPPRMTGHLPNEVGEGDERRIDYAALTSRSAFSARTVWRSACTVFSISAPPWVAETKPPGAPMTSTP